VRLGTSDASGGHPGALLARHERRAIVVRMDELRVAPGPGAPTGLVVPARELVEQFSHASGPGGQGVNTADSRVQLSLDLATTSALTDVQRTRALARLASQLNGTVLTITASEHRSQRKNRAAARERLAAVLRSAVVPAPVRRPTRPTRGSQRRRLAAKRERAEVKRARRRPGPGGND
jgi:ribosome-associated protein